MKKYAPLAVCAVMLLATGAAYSADSMTPDVKSQTESKTEVQSETVQSPVGVTTTSESAKKEETSVKSSEADAKTSPVFESSADKPATDATGGATATSPNVAPGQEATAPAAPATNVQKLFGIFTPNKQAEANPSSTPDAKQTETPTNTQTPQ